MKKKSIFFISLAAIILVVMLAFPASAYARRNQEVTIQYSFAGEPVTINLPENPLSDPVSYLIEIYGVPDGSYMNFTGYLQDFNSYIITRLGAGNYGVKLNFWITENSGEVLSASVPLTISLRPYLIINSPGSESKINTLFFSKEEALAAAKTQVTDFLNRADILASTSAMPNEQFLNYLYDAIFHRMADTGGLNNWVNELNSGMARGDVINSFINSPEFELKYIIAVEGGNSIVIEENTR